jgi:ElaB/YqjD/DUF883 family membrane-anchored ribosome-binding protein
MTTREVRREVESLKKDLDRLQDDLRKITQRGGSAARSASSEALEGVKGAAAGVLQQGSERAKEFYHDASDAVRDRGEDLVETVVERVEERPLAAVLLTLGAGFALGVLLTRGRGN